PVSLNSLYKSMRKSFAFVVAMGLASMPILGEDKKDEAAEHFEKTIKPILKNHCYDCHDADVRKGDLDLTVFKNLEEVKAAPEIWQNVYQRVHAFEMPPKGKKELNFDQ